MTTEKYTNRASSALAAGIDDDDTTLTVDDATTFPTAGNFRVIIGDELMIVTAVSGDTFTVTRGAEGTTPASHDMGDSVTHIVTAASIRNIVSQIVSTDLTAADFTAINSPTTTDLDGAVVFRSPPNTSAYLVRALARPFAAGDTVTICVDVNAMRIGSTNQDYGVGFRDSVGGRALYLHFFGQTGSRTPEFRVARYSTISAWSSNQFIAVQPPWGSRLWFRLSNISTTLKFEFSADGEAWATIYTESETAYLANAPNQVYIGSGYWASASTEPDLTMTIRQWLEQ